MTFKAPRGTKDIFGDDIYVWQKVEAIIRGVCEKFYVSEIRTPIFEQTELFQRGVGETTDIVTKEMYTLEKKGGESVTLKPEGTAGVARAFVENSLYAGAQPTKLYYITPAFRYERPQAGRQRQFHQFGAEFFGSFDSSCDAEAISLAFEVLNKIGIKNIELRINSLGGNECRKKYNKVLREFIGNNIDSLCDDCCQRFQKNPLRVLDCKNEKCKNVIQNAPSVIDCLGEKCFEHFDKLKKSLDNMGIPYVVDPKIVRGLDYYTRTVFEFVSNEIGSQGTVCGGGRYDNLIGECGGPETGAVGFAMGLERIIMLIKSQGLFEMKRGAVDLYIGSIGAVGFAKAQAIGYNLRRAGVRVEYDTLGRSVKSQLKYANKINAVYSVIIGENEIKNDCVSVRNMSQSSQEDVRLSCIENEIIGRLS